MGDVAEGMGWRASTLHDAWGPAEFVFEVSRQKLLYQLPADRCLQIAPHQFSVIFKQGESCRLWVKGAGQRRNPLVLHQLQELLFGEVAGFGDVKVATAVLNRKSPIPWNDVVFFNVYVVQWLGAEAF